MENLHFIFIFIVIFIIVVILYLYNNNIEHNKLNNTNAIIKQKSLNNTKRDIKHTKLNNNNNIDTPDTSINDNNTDTPDISINDNNTDTPDTSINDNNTDTPDTSINDNNTDTPDTSINDNNKDDLKKEITTFAKGIVISVIVDSIKRQIVNKIDKKIMSKMSDKPIKSLLSKFGMKSTPEIMTKLSKKLVPKSATIVAKKITTKLSKQSLMIGAKTAAKVALKLAATVATKVAAKAAAAAAKTGIKVAMGPAGWALMCFDVASMGLDFADMGTNFTGFQNVANNKEIDKLQKMANDTLITSFKEENLDLPINGPLENLNEDILKQDASDITDILMNIYTEKYLENVDNKFAIDMSKYQIDDNQKENAVDNLLDEILQPLTEYFKTDEFLQEVDKHLCIEYDGLFIDGKCSYKDKYLCDANNTVDNYYEFINGKCILTSGYAKELCTKHNLPYIAPKQHCKIDNMYCTRASSTFRSNNDGECYDNAGVTVGGFIGGDTIAKGVRKLFDLDYTYPREVKPIRVKTYCDGNQKDVDGVCADDCNPRYEKDSSSTCSIKADTRHRNRMFRKVQCPSDREEDQGMCSLKCHSGKNRDSSSTCSGCQKAKEICVKWPLIGRKCTPGIPSCESQNRHPITMFDFLEDCPDGWEKVGAECVQTCNSMGLSNDYAQLPTTCTRPISSQYRNPKVIKNSSYCDDPDNFNVFGAACYKKCKDGYRTDGVQCTLKTCPKGQSIQGKDCVSLNEINKTLL